jgi:phosphohistidine phosphatase
MSLELTTIAFGGGDSRWLNNPQRDSRYPQSLARVLPHQSPGDYKRARAIAGSQSSLTWCVMNTLIYIARHAWAYETGDPRWPDDSLRELEPEGAERYQRMIAILTQRDFAPEVIATSPYTRCRQTADIISQNTALRPAVSELAELKPDSDFEALTHWSRQTRCHSICWVGHAPDVTWLASMLVGDRDANIRFAKGAVAAIRMHGDIGFGQGELVWLATAKLMGV